MWIRLNFSVPSKNEPMSSSDRLILFLEVETLQKYFIEELKAKNRADETTRNLSYELKNAFRETGDASLGSSALDFRVRLKLL